ncbi:MAG: elongation factor G [Chitinivibrionales bacterium]|nr:elongation factor G [Chitinivibrionales bacterium]
MKTYEAGSIRNVALVSHGGVGKTTLTEAASFTAKATKKLGSVDNATSVFDARWDEKERKMTISMAVGSLEWKDTKINLIDTPGFLDFQGDVIAALRMAESAVVLISASDGIEVGTEIFCGHIDEADIPRLFFVNGLDKENVDYEKTIADLKDYFGTSIAPLTWPIGDGASFNGVVDLVTKEAFEYTPGGNGTGKRIDIPGELAESIAAKRSELMEAIAESDEELMNKYFEEGELSDDDLRKGLSQGVAQGLVFPVLCGCASQNAGSDILLNTITTLSPSPLAKKEITVVESGEEKKVPCSAADPASAFVFKTISEEHVGELNIIRVFGGKVATGMELANPVRAGSERIGNMYTLCGHDKRDATEIVAGDIGGLLKLKDTHTNDTLVDKSLNWQFKKIAYPDPLVRVAIRSKSKGDEDKIGIGINKLSEEDATFTYQFHPDIRQSILSAMGDVHLDIILNNLKNRFKVEVEKITPKISYRETITKPVKYVEYTHKKQTGGAGQYARVFIDLEPLPRGEGYAFEDKIVGGVIDQSLRPSVDKGIRARIEEGILAGYPIVDFKIALVDGKTHPVDSKDIAFQIAGREVFKKAFEMAGPILLEPFAELKVTVPDDFTGDVMGDLSSRRGKIGGMEPLGKKQRITALLPESEIMNYSQSLRSITQGRGFFTKKFSSYEPVPPDQTAKIVEQSKKASEEEH